MKKVVIGMLAALALPALVCSQDLATVDQIIDKYLQALGGKEHLEKLTNRVARGTYSVPEWEVKGPHEIYAKAPNKSMSTTTFEGWGVFRQGFNGSAGWAEDPDSGLRDLSGGELDEMKFNSEFHRNVKLKELYPGLAVKGKDGDSYRLEATLSGGLLQKLYFDAQSGLLVRIDSQSRMQDGSRMTTVTLLGDYRDVGGVKEPFSIEQTNPNFGSVLNLDKVEHNVPVDDAKFEKPAAK